jgi:hypothetical protein
VNILQHAIAIGEDCARLADVVSQKTFQPAHGARRDTPQGAADLICAGAPVWAGRATIRRSIPSSENGTVVRSQHSGTVRAMVAHAVDFPAHTSPAISAAFCIAGMAFE